MKLKNQGIMHPEKFHKKMIELTDMSEEQFLIHEEICDTLINLENLNIVCGIWTGWRIPDIFCIGNMAHVPVSQN